LLIEDVHYEFESMMRHVKKLDTISHEGPLDRECEEFEIHIVSEQ
jgi:hypothetical protein